MQRTSCPVVILRCERQAALHCEDLGPEHLAAQLSARTQRFHTAAFCTAFAARSTGAKMQFLCLRRDAAPLLVLS
eukprot:927448-Alexandrium_andersonii.AAC.1